MILTLTETEGYKVCRDLHAPPGFIISTPAWCPLDASWTWHETPTSAIKHTGLKSSRPTPPALQFSPDSLRPAPSSVNWFAGSIK